MAVLQQVAPETRVQLVVEGADGLARDVELDPAAEVDRFVVDRGLVFQPVYRLVKAGSVGAALASGSRKVTSCRCSTLPITSIRSRGL